MKNKIETQARTIQNYRRLLIEYQREHANRGGKSDNPGMRQDRSVTRTSVLASSRGDPFDA